MANKHMEGSGASLMIKDLQIVAGTHSEGAPHTHSDGSDAPASPPPKKTTPKNNEN